MRDSPQYITSVSWSRTKNELIAIGFSNGYIEIWDADRKVCIRQFKSHITRVSSLSWNTHILTSGSISGDIHNYDIRIANQHISALTIHNHEICGLEWSPNGRFLASGADDNTGFLFKMDFQFKKLINLSNISSHYLGFNNVKLLRTFLQIQKA